MTADLLHNALRRESLLSSFGGRTGLHAVQAERPLAMGTRAVVDVVVTHDEVNNRHGTGILVQRLFADSEQVVSIRASSTYNQEQSWGRLQLMAPAGLQGDRASLARWVLQIATEYDIRNIVCVPFGEAEIQMSLALHDVTGAPLCLYVMDDRNYFSDGISDNLFQEAAFKAQLRLAISSDMADLYGAKFGHKFWIVPPTIVHPIVPEAKRHVGSAVIIGNIWANSWIDALRRVIRESGLTVTWFTNNVHASWISTTSDELLADGITILPPLPEAELLGQLRQFELAIMPSAPDLQTSDNRNVAALSLPSKVPFLVGSGILPILVLGDSAACAARFVEHFQIGASADYEPAPVAAALERIRAAEFVESAPARWATLREILTVDDLPGWLSQAIDTGVAPSTQFEQLVVNPRLTIPQYTETHGAPPLWLGHLEPLRNAIRRLTSFGYQPNYVIDVGASNGVWSATTSEFFQNPKYVLIDPLHSSYDRVAADEYLSKLADHHVFECAVSSEPGEMSFYVDRHLFGASLLPEGASPSGSVERRVPVRTLDEIGQTVGLRGSGLAKLDVQGAELMALDGASGLLADSLDVLILEVTLDPTGALPSFVDVCTYLLERGFVIFDESGEWRDPGTGMLLQKDVVFVKRDHELANFRRRVAS
jgi:FkbM family methyltransferase